MTLVDRVSESSDVHARDGVVIADVTDRRAIAELISRDSIELVVNTAGPYRETMIPVLESALSTGIAYVDMAEGATETQGAIALAERAKEAGSICWVGMGNYPGLTNILAMSAAKRLDRVESISVALAINASAVVPDQSSLAELRSTLKVGAGGRSMLEGAAPPFSIYRDGDLRREATSHTVSFLAPSDDTVSLSVQSHAESVTLPTAIPTLTAAATYLGFVPREADDAFRGQVTRAAEGGTSAAEAMVTFMETIASDTHRFESQQPATQIWAEAKGTRRGQQTSVAAWAPGNWATAFRLLSETAIAVADGRLIAPGVHTAEDLVDADAFLTSAADRAGITNRPLIHHRITQA